MCVTARTHICVYIVRVCVCCVLVRNLLANTDNTMHRVILRWKGGWRKGGGTEIADEMKPVTAKMKSQAGGGPDGVIPWLLSQGCFASAAPLLTCFPAHSCRGCTPGRAEKSAVFSRTVVRWLYS